MSAIQVATLPLGLELSLLDRVLTGIEAALDEFGATRVWIELDDSSFVIMAEMPTTEPASDLCQHRRSRSANSTRTVGTHVRLAPSDVRTARNPDLSREPGR